MTITQEKKLKLLQIEQARLVLNKNIINGLISESDILDLLHKPPYYGLKTKSRIYSYKQSVLISIFNSPFVLCDQDELSLSVKKILPLFLNARYQMEIDELMSYYKDGYITKEELEKEEKILKFCYYESSLEGKSILKSGHVDCVLDNIVKLR